MLVFNPFTAKFMMTSLVTWIFYFFIVIFVILTFSKRYNLKASLDKIIYYDIKKVYCLRKKWLKTIQTCRYQWYWLKFYFWQSWSCFRGKVHTQLIHLLFDGVWASVPLSAQTTQRLAFHLPYFLVVKIIIPCYQTSSLSTLFRFSRSQSRQSPLS